MNWLWSMIDVSGRLVTRAEFELLQRLSDGDRTAQGLILATRQEGWLILRRLTSLEERGLVAHYHNEENLVGWTLTPAGLAPFVESA